MASLRARVADLYSRAVIRRHRWGLLLQVGADELLLDDARRVHDRVLAAGGVSRLSIYAGVIHGWHLCAPLVPEATRAIDEVATFLREHVR